MSPLTVQVQARRRACSGACEWSDVTVTLALREDLHGTVLEVTDGCVTGYESFYLNGMTSWSAKWQAQAWTACAGMTGSWDTLRICASEMDRALRVLGVGS